jgi:hypothetical protein
MIYASLPSSLGGGLTNSLGQDAGNAPVPDI